MRAAPAPRLSAALSAAAAEPTLQSLHPAARTTPLQRRAGRAPTVGDDCWLLLRSHGPLKRAYAPLRETLPASLEQRSEDAEQLRNKIIAGMAYSRASALLFLCG